MSALETYTLQLTIHVAVYLCLQGHVYITESACGMRAYVHLWFGLDIFVCLHLCVFQHLLMCSSVCLCVCGRCVWYFTVFCACLNFVHFRNYLLKAMSLPDPFFSLRSPFCLLSFFSYSSLSSPASHHLICCFCLWQRPITEILQVILLKIFLTYIFSHIMRQIAKYQFWGMPTCVISMWLIAVLQYNRNN